MAIHPFPKGKGFLAIKDKLSFADIPPEVLKEHILPQIITSSFNESEIDIKNASMSCKCIYKFLADQRKQLKLYKLEIEPHFQKWILNIFNSWTDILKLTEVKFDTSSNVYDKITQDKFKDPISRGICSDNVRFIAIKFIEKNYNESIKRKCLFLLKNINLSVTSPSLILIFREITENIFIIDKIRSNGKDYSSYFNKLLNGKDVGSLKKYLCSKAHYYQNKAIDEESPSIEFNKEKLP